MNCPICGEEIKAGEQTIEGAAQKRGLDGSVQDMTVLAHETCALRIEMSKLGHEVFQLKALVAAILHHQGGVMTVLKADIEGAKAVNYEWEGNEGLGGATLLELRKVVVAPANALRLVKQ